MRRARRFRQVSCILLAVGLLITGVTATARGKGDTEDTTALSITAPDSASPGETVSVIITTPDEQEAISAVLYSMLEEPVVRAQAFPLDRDKKSAYRFAAFIPLGTLSESGVYRLEIHCGNTIVTRELRVEHRDFIEETIPLDNKNTAIKSDTSKKRMEQINKLTKILQTVSTDAPIFPGPFVSPVSATRRTSHFGDRRTYRYSNGKTRRDLHFGIDYGIPTGTPVFASGDGRIVMAESRITTGWTVVIEHLPGIYSLYYHLDHLDTAEGEFVRAGTLIGKSGCTGLSTGPHLHWEFRVNGEAVDPDWFAGRVLF